MQAELNKLYPETLEELKYRSAPIEQELETPKVAISQNEYSPLTNYVNISPHKTTLSGKVNRKITVHHMAGNLSVETCGNVFQNYEASANYGIGSDGRVGCYVYENDRAWASADYGNDSQSVNIEVANDEYGGNWHVSDTAFNKLVDLCVDICKRNSIPKLIWTGDANGTLTCHYMFMATACPGPYLKGRMVELATLVNNRLETIKKPNSPLNPIITSFDGKVTPKSKIRMSWEAPEITKLQPIDDYAVIMYRRKHIGDVDVLYRNEHIEQTYIDFDLNTLPDLHANTENILFAVASRNKAGGSANAWSRDYELQKPDPVRATIETGKEVMAIDCRLYMSTISEDYFDKLNSNYYIFNDKVTNNRVRICKLLEDVGVNGKAIGWADITSLFEVEE